MNNEEENTTSSHSPTLVLQKGIVLFKKRLSLNEQKSLVETANDLNLGSTSFRCHNEKARHMQMRTLKHPRIPPILVDLYSDLINEAELASPAVAPTRRLGVCVANQYSAISRLSLHDELGTRGAVVSMSVGDSAVFVYKNSWKKKSSIEENHS
ncbi:hypothetical protein BDR26DRAFT_73001 [Obelidium mucronatum]|nr:hypothetical protein BDR26DRAFT_73001 [Obelidium mucronatum]